MDGVNLSQTTIKQPRSASPATLSNNMITQDQRKRENISNIPVSNSMIRQNTANSLMDATGQIIYRRSPTFQNNNNNNTLVHNQQPQSYETLVSSLTTTNSYNSGEEVGETLISSFGAASIDESEIDEPRQGHFNDQIGMKFDWLQRKIDTLTKNQASQDEQYKRTKQENELLLTRIHSLEDQLRDLEFNSEARVKLDEKRFKEIMAKNARVEKECEHQIQTIGQLQHDLTNLKKDLIKNEALLKSLRSEREKLEAEVTEKNSELNELDSQMHKLKLAFSHLQEEDLRKENIISILNEELEDYQSRSQNNISTNNISSFNQTGNNNTQSELHNISSDSSKPYNSHTRVCSSPRTSITSGFEEDFLSSQLNNRALKDIDGLEMNLAKLRDENQQLRQVNEELQAQLLNAQLEEGRCLVQESNKSYSLADEMGDIDVQRLLKALNEQQEVNARLRRYVDEILIKVLERNPEILDKTQTSESNCQNNDSCKNNNMAEKQPVNNIP